MIFYNYLRRQIPVMIFISVFTGTTYLILGYVYDIFLPALLWYISIVAVSIWGHFIYKSYKQNHMCKDDKYKWYKKLAIYYYAIFSLWSLIFFIYVPHSENNMHFVAIFTQIGTAVVASVLLFSEKRLFLPLLLVFMLPLFCYFILVGEWFTYLLSILTLVFTWVLYYSASSSNKLLHKTHHQASHDMLTGLKNRHTAIDFLQENINALKKEGDTSYIFLIDLDHFKTINDTLGHDVGDLLLQEVSKRMRIILNATHYIARLGGDEFIIIPHNYRNSIDALKEAKTIATNLLNSLKEIYNIENHQLYISASIGISIIDDNKRSANDYIKEADIAMYEVKSRGKDDIFVFDRDLSQQIQRHLELESLLPFGLENSEFYLEFQPQMNIDGRIIGCEALTRWHNEKYSTISPIEFIPIAEQSTHILKLGSFIIEEAFKTLKVWHDKGLILEQFSINLSMKQLFYHKFIPDLELLCEKYLTPALQNMILFEVTESVLAKDFKTLTGIMNQLNEKGFRFSLDDFGTGYSSLNYLSQLPIHELKIDKSFILALDETKENTIVNTIISMAKSFKYSLVAEGVEKQHQLDYLRNKDCDIIQGYFFSKPLSKKDFEVFYESHKS